MKEIRLFESSIKISDCNAHNVDTLGELSDILCATQSRDYSNMHRLIAYFRNEIWSMVTYLHNVSCENLAIFKENECNYSFLLDSRTIASVKITTYIGNDNLGFGIYLKMSLIVYNPLIVQDDDYELLELKRNEASRFLGAYKENNVEDDRSNIWKDDYAQYRECGIPTGGVECGVCLYDKSGKSHLVGTCKNFPKKCEYECYNYEAKQ